MKTVTLVLMLKSKYQNVGTEAKEKLQGELNTPIFTLENKASELVN